MMPETSSPKKCRLKNAHIDTHGDHHNLTIVLSGQELALAEATHIISAANKDYYVERSPENNAIKIVMPLTGSDIMSSAADHLQYLRKIAGFCLSGVHLQPEYEVMGTGDKTLYMPQIIIHPLIKKGDKYNIAGKLVMELIRRDAIMQDGYVPDPNQEEGTLRLFHLTNTFKTDIEALASAESGACAIENHYGIFKARHADLSLLNLHTLRTRNPRNKKSELSVAVARLQGEPDGLKDAFRILKRRHGPKIAQMNNGEDFLDVGMAEENGIDPTGLLATLHMTTGCKLPVDIEPTVMRKKEFPYSYEPVLETRIDGDETGRALPTMRFASARYIGAMIPEDHSVPQEMDPHAPMRVTMHSFHDKEESARRTAEDIAQRVRERIRHIGAGNQRAR